MLNLPVELLEMIATHPSLSLQDICRLSLTCKRLQYVVTSSWGKIAVKRWNWWSECSAKTNDEWYLLCRERYLCEIKVNSLLYDTIKRGVRQYLVDDEEMEVYENLVRENGCCSQKVMDCVLLEILSEGISDANLSHQYYVLCVYEYLQRQILKEKWKKLLNSKHQLLIEGAILITQWINPLSVITSSSIENEIDRITELVTNELLISSTEHTATKDPVHSSSTTTSIVHHINTLGIPRNDILKTINKVMFDKLGFKPATDDYYKLENSLIDQVLDRRRGIPITLSALYQCIAYKLGVKLLPVLFPSHFLLKAEQDLISGDGEVYIDAYGRGQLLSQTDCLSLVPFLTAPQPHIFEAVEPHKAMIRMVANIYSRGHLIGLSFDVGRHWQQDKLKWGPLVLPSSLSLQLCLCYLSPVCDFTRIVSAEAAGIALDLRYNTKQVLWVMSHMLLHGASSVHVLTKLQRAQTSAEKRKKVLAEITRVKRRDVEKVWFSVGMIMKHRRYQYRCVIYGWDIICDMNEQWIQQMGVNQLPLGPNQPFYNVLVEDGTNRYAAQENLFHCPETELCHILHWEVGKYFQTFTGSCYIPNHALREKYPD